MTGKSTSTHKKEYPDYDESLEDEYSEQVHEQFDAGELDPLDSVQEAADGCSVESDGICPHGYRSPAYLLGII
jgi:hypothetical protein